MVFLSNPAKEELARTAGLLVAAAGLEPATYGL
jgi:hypothetical protein